MKDGSNECFIQLKEGLFKGPRCRGCGAECFKAGEKLCADELDM